MKLIIFAYSLLSTILYIWYTWKYKLETFSHSYYVLPKNRVWMFYLFLFNIGYPLAYVSDAIEMLIAALLLTLVIFAPAFRNEKDKPDYIDKRELLIHMIGAIAPVIMAWYTVSFVYKLWWPTLLLGLGLIGILFIKKRRGYWGELFCFFLFYLTIIIHDIL